MTLPPFITAIKTFTYGTEMIRDNFPDWTDEEILEYIDEMAEEDLGKGFWLVDADKMEGWSDVRSRNW